eukprot:CAMPEP_0116091694 /NCGR_PEP_ID=MMETSP0327-20121206/7641_1 /TAXON_ID=44447 /ORGANISM="Pseudo-nitzschia delicatissima, Strain B596" /LENGTH=581 /DNA_ID=CAMNT_0003583061 /DNA_START=102 /DNA_END=1847 /DNA_ORIENTATION=-
MSEEDSYAIQAVDPSWFESPAQRLTHSGGTAPFFLLKLTQEGLEGVRSRNAPSFKNRTIDENYWIGKDLSHAADEKDFYLNVLKIRSGYSADGDPGDSRDLTEGIGVVEAFMFDYLGVLRTKTSDGGDETADLLVMRNMRNSFKTFRMLDLKIGEKTAQAGWKGKSRLRAMKHHLMDGLSNSASEGYRLAGFNGCPEVFDSMEPLLDITKTEALKQETESGWQTFWGRTIDDSQYAQAKRFMLNSLDGTGVFRFFYDLHMDGNFEMDTYLPIEVAEIVSHELTDQLVRLASACQHVTIPQKWIGSSVAVCFDSGFFPERTLESAEADIRNKVLCKIFDWGRSELLTAEEYDAMTPDQKADRDKFWQLYKHGIERCAYNATRFYYHQFTKTTLYSDITVQVYDFDSMSSDDYIGKVVIELPDHTNKEALEALKGSKTYKLEGMVAHLSKSTLSCSIEWQDFPESSRLQGCWKVTIEKAENLPALDGLINCSDPYCMVMGNTTQTDGQHFNQRTCVIARNLNPEWNETIAVPVAKKDNTLTELTGSNKHELSDRLKWDKTWSFNRTSKSDMDWWRTKVLGGDK